MLLRPGGASSSAARPRQRVRPFSYYARPSPATSSGSSRPKTCARLLYMYSSMLISVKPENSHHVAPLRPASPRFSPVFCAAVWFGKRARQRGNGPDVGPVCFVTCRFVPGLGKNLLAASDLFTSNPAQLFRPGEQCSQAFKNNAWESGNSDPLFIDLI